MKLHVVAERVWILHCGKCNYKYRGRFSATAAAAGDAEEEDDGDIVIKHRDESSNSITNLQDMQIL